MRAEIERRIDEATNQVLAVRTPSVLVTERLDIRGKAKSRRLSRIVSTWARKYLKDRVELKASARVVTVHPLPPLAGGTEEGGEQLPNELVPPSADRPRGRREPRDRST
ncbi:MAG: hypothetical protein HYV63_16850 [Candidatus Schekmanbacteria bacterium]|nr:hypothetical protein [Candidatus Schekmanbacteria bacterium]